MLFVIGILCKQHSPSMRLARTNDWQLRQLNTSFASSLTLSSPQPRVLSFPFECLCTRLHATKLMPCACVFLLCSTQLVDTLNRAKFAKNDIDISKRLKYRGIMQARSRTTPPSFSLWPYQITLFVPRYPLPSRLEPLLARVKPGKRVRLRVQHDLIERKEVVRTE